MRKEMAKALERKVEDLRPYLTVRDRDVLKEAKLKVESQSQEAGRDLVKKGFGKDGAKKGGRFRKDASSSGKGFSEQGPSGRSFAERPLGKGGAGQWPNNR